MEKVTSHLNKAYNYLSRLQVSGDAVDLVALIRMELRTAYEEAEKKEKETEASEDGQTD